MIPEKAVRAEAFCSTANLGAGFDVFGLALNKYADRVHVRTANTRTVRIKIQGPYSRELPRAPDKNSAGPPAQALQLALVGGGYVDRIMTEKDSSIIAVVGSGMKGTPGVAARVFGAVAKRRVNVRMVAQGSSEYNISFVVSDDDGAEAVRAIHEEFRLGE